MFSSNDQQHPLFQPLLDFCHSSQVVTLNSICEYIAIQYVPFLATEVKKDLSLTREEQEVILSDNLKSAINLASAVLDEKFPAEKPWIELISFALRGASPQLVKLGMATLSGASTGSTGSSSWFGSSRACSSLTWLLTTGSFTLFVASVALKLIL